MGNINRDEMLKLVNENISRLKKAGANKVVSPEIIGGQDLYFESAKPHLLRITVKHSSDEIYDEFEVIAKHGCTLENIEYHKYQQQYLQQRTIQII